MSEGPVERLRVALLRGETFTRPEACERFEISGSTFRWLLQSMRADGVTLTYEEERGRRNAPTRRWKVEN